MTNNQNIEVITDKLMGFINSDSLDRHTRVEIVKRMLEISEKYAPDSSWYMETVRKIFEEAGDLVTQETVNSHIKLIEELREDEDVI